MNVPMSAKSQLTNETPLLNQQTGTVCSVEGNRCQIEIAGVTYQASISTHLLSLQPGQRVVALCDEENNWLITAAWPTASEETSIHYDTETGALHIEAPRLKFAALGSVELHCGDARISLSVDGKVRVLGNEVLSSAVGSQRIEGATIDLN
jgi:hypothetical protein